MAEDGDGELIKAGMLTKRSGGKKGVKTWRNRYFELRGTNLYYYKQKGGEELGNVSLAGCTVLPANHMKKQHCFQIHHPTRRTYYIFAATAIEMIEWMEALQEAVPTLESAERILYVYNDPSQNRRNSRSSSARMSTPILDERRTSAATMRNSLMKEEEETPPPLPPREEELPLRSNLKGVNPPRPKRPLVFGDDVKTEWIHGDAEDDILEEFAPPDLRETTDPTRLLVRHAEIDPDETDFDRKVALDTATNLAESRNMDILFAGWVAQVNQEKRIMERRLFVLLSYAFYLLLDEDEDEPTKPPTLLYEVPLFDLVTIQSYNPDDMRIEWSDNAVILAATDARIRYIVQKLLGAMNAITVSWREENMIDIDISRLLPPIEQPADTRLGGLIPCYKANCVFQGVPYNEDLLEYLTTQSPTAEELDLSTLPDHGAVTLNDLKCLVAAITHNTSFEAVSFAHVPCKAFAQHAAVLVSQTDSLKRLDLSHMNISVGWWEFGMGLREAGAECTLTDLDISGNAIPEKALAAMAVGLVSVPLKRLCLSSCGLSPKALTVLASTLARDSLASKTLEELDVSHNRASGPGSKAIVQWAANSEALRTLNVASCSFNVTELGTVFSLQPDTVQLTSLDLSDSVFDKKASNIMVDCVAVCTTLVDLKLSDCSISRACLGSLFEGLVGTARKDVSFTAERVDINVEGLQQIVSIVNEGVSLVELNLDQTKIKTQGTCQLLQSLMTCPTLTSLNISRNFKPKHNQIDVVVRLLCELVSSSNHKISSLSVAGDHTKHFLGASLLPLISTACKDAPSLTELDVSSNRCPGAVATLARHLCNPANRLVKVNFDGNDTSFEDVCTFRAALEDNSTLTEFTVPATDLRGMVKAAKTKGDLDAILLSIAHYLDRNASGTFRRETREWGIARHSIMADSLADLIGPNQAVPSGWEDDEEEDSDEDGGGAGPSEEVYESVEDVDADAVEAEQAEILRAEVARLAEEAERTDTLKRKQQQGNADFVPGFNTVGIRDNKDSGIVGAPVMYYESESEDSEDSYHPDGGDGGGAGPAEPAAPAAAVAAE